MFNSSHWFEISALVSHHKIHRVHDVRLSSWVFLISRDKESHILEIETVKQTDRICIRSRTLTSISKWIGTDLSNIRSVSFLCFLILAVLKNPILLKTYNAACCCIFCFRLNNCYLVYLCYCLTCQLNINVHVDNFVIG